MSEVLGIDVSHYQGVIDWKLVAQAGKKFAILKCMYEAQSHRKDEYFEENYRKAGIYGVARGVYIFIASASIKDPQTDANALLKHLADRPLEYGIWLDFESDVLAKQGKQKIEEMALYYASVFRSAGYFTGIYCNKYWYDTLITDKLKKEFDFWIARYPRKDEGVYNPTSALKPGYTQAVAWQYSSKGRVPGINGNVDLDVDYDGVVNLIAKTPEKKSNFEIAYEVLCGIWGTKNTNPTRRQLLTTAGYNYGEIQAIVTDWLKKKSNEQVAKEVLERKWGTKDTIPTRKELLTKCGYDYDAIQKIVNEWIGR